MTISHESVALVNNAVNLIYRAYPTAKVVVIADWARQDVTGLKARFVQSTPMKNHQNGAKWWDRLFREALKESGSLIFKIDPDSHVNHPLSFVPSADCFGTLLGPGEVQEHIQGGCQGFWRGAVERIVESGCLLDEAYKDWKTWAFGHGAVDQDNNYDPKSDSPWAGYLSTDRILMHVLRRLNLTWANHPEICCYFLWDERPMPAFDMAAISHPHK